MNEPERDECRIFFWSTAAQREIAILVFCIGLVCFLIPSVASTLAFASASKPIPSGAYIIIPALVFLVPVLSLATYRQLSERVITIEQGFLYLLYKPRRGQIEFQDILEVKSIQFSKGNIHLIEIRYGANKKEIVEVDDIAQFISLLREKCEDYAVFLEAEPSRLLRLYALARRFPLLTSVLILTPLILIGVVFGEFGYLILWLFFMLGLGLQLLLRDRSSADET